MQLHPQITEFGSARLTGSPLATIMAAAGPSYELTCLRAVAMRTSQRRRITTVTPIPIPFLQHTTLKSGSSFGQLRVIPPRSEEHTSELQSRGHLVCRLLLETKNTKI